MAERTGARNIGWLKALVFFMGAVIVVGFIVVFIELGRRIMKPPAAEPLQPGAPTVPGPPPARPRSFGEVNIAIPEGARVESVSTVDGRIVAFVRLKDGQGALHIVDPASGALLGVVRFAEDKR